MLASRYENVEKAVTEIMGGKVLNYRSKEIFLEGREAGFSQGRNEGLSEGRSQRDIELVTGKYKRGESLEKIAEDLLMDVKEVESILKNNKA